MKQIDVGCRPVLIIKHLKNGVTIGKTDADGYIAADPNSYSWRSATLKELYTCGIVNLFGKQIKIISLIAFLTFILFESWLLYHCELKAATQFNLSVALVLAALSCKNLLRF
jgi:hypothetical protein